MNDLTLAGARCSLRAFTANDMQWLVPDVSADPGPTRFRTGGRSIPPEDMAGVFWDSTSYQFTIVRSDDRLAAGVVQLYRLDWAVRTARFGAFLRPGLRRQVWPWQGIFLGVQHAFDILGLHRIFVETSDLASQAFASVIDRHLEMNATLSEHQFIDGQYGDLRIASLSRDRWQRVTRPRLEELGLLGTTPAP